MKEFALYKGDTFIDIGTKSELAAKYKIAKNTLQHAAGPKYIKQAENNNKIILIKLDDEDEEE